MILEIFPNLNDSMILTLFKEALNSHYIKCNSLEYLSTHAQVISAVLSPLLRGLWHMLASWPLGGEWESKSRII